MVTLKSPINKHVVLKSTWISFLLAIALAFFSFSSHGQSNGWYTAKLIEEKTWLLEEHGIDNSYLIEGKDSALLIDVGFGVTNLRDFVKSLTAKPLIVVNTHQHPDHIGGNYQFSKVYVGAQDIETVRGYLDPKKMKPITDMILKDILIPDSLKFIDTANLKATVLVPIRDGHVFKLGDRDIKVISVPGHTPGSICLIDEKHKLLFTGDNNNPEVWLFFEESLPVETYLQSLQKLSKSKNIFKTLLPGHGPAVKKEILEDLVQCSKLILSGKCKTKPFHNFLGSGTACTYKAVTIAFDTKKIKQNR
jgi:glyoxylase-like metal-dependent hydrolase (beta-lactamase superfamily II)